MHILAKRPLFSVGGIFRRWGPEYESSRAVPTFHRRVIRDLSVCRTAALGGHLEQCDSCGYEHPAYNSCRNRHCPQCQSRLARRWLSDRLSESLPVPYFHCVFTIPDSFRVLVPGNERVIYDLLFRAAWQTLKHLFQRDLGVEPGVIAVLHTWGQTLWLHPHVHCIVTGGGLSLDGQRWISTSSEYLFDVYELSAEFKRRFCGLLRRRRGKLKLAGAASKYSDPAEFGSLVSEQESRNWVVHCKPPFAGSESVLEYVSRYTFRVAISNHRIEDVSADGTVTFSYQDNRESDGEGVVSQKSMQMEALEFMRRFLVHVLPVGFRKIRMYGILGGQDKASKLRRCRELLGVAPESAAAESPPSESEAERLCPHCGSGRMRPAGELSGSLVLVYERGPPLTRFLDAA